MRRAALVAAVALLAAPAGAGATEVSRADLVDLAERAPTDSAALEELRAVTSVDGVPADLESTLAGVEGDDLDARLEEIARSAEDAPPAGLEAAEARARVEEILAGDPPDPPPPSDGGEGVEVPSPSLPLGLVIAVVIVALAIAAASQLGRRTILEREASAGGSNPKRSGARDLSREADEAEGRGDFGAAVRLRFQAGLTRLDELGSIELRPSLTASGAVHESGLAAIAGLATAYERVAFGGRTASAGDAETQRTGWKKVVDEVRETR
ncbi:MAG: DUF4129 domain-containing protein [Actinomycetota bacterium]|nr:DUF4129 domain-containing protein [Actinomycetota bacterium]